MNDQEMQFADPDWQPTRPLQERTAARTPEAYTPQPINGDMRERPQQPPVETPPEYQDGYAGSIPPQGEIPFQYQRPVYRRRGRSPWLWIILAILFFSLLGGGFGVRGLLGQKSSVETKDFTNLVNGTPTIVIHETNGNIHVDRGNGLTIQATRYASFFDDPNNIQVTFDQEGNTINVNVNTGDDSFSDRSVDFTVTVPQNANLTLSTTSGDVSVNNVDGAMTLESVSGDVSATNDTFSSNATLKTTSGDVKTAQDSFSSDTTISTISGDITMDQDALNGQSLISTTSGDIRFDGTIGSSGIYQFQAESGDIHIGLPPSPSFHVEASTQSGSIDIGDFHSVNVQENDSGSGSHASGDVGANPGASITITTGSGDISLHQNS